MVNIDTVYQKVLAFANKEQRGYLTPQEFNLFANQAQLEIYEQYFYDLSGSAGDAGNETQYADVGSILDDKLSIFYMQVNGISPTLNVFTLPINVHRIDRLTMNVASDTSIPYAPANNLFTTEIEKVSHTDFLNANSAPLTQPHISRPIYHKHEEEVTILPSVDFTTGHRVDIAYYRAPATATWGYLVLNGKALYNSDPTRTQHFELHSSDETELVYKILKYAGVAMKKQDIPAVAQGLESVQVQQEKQ
tara:strand:+ start:1060 stop:1806 length:747 start_codon:yes stop_codon:yes gene_type:complete